ncbi:hypothetical protein U9M48_020603 [Paspalum notatum var. saurae]|uniref:Uncharacterized protein n=1 Tax=Paspalum notatum var. saurae TaxID=547442 RepID=A0AAQ3TF45_PASNO
MRNASGSFWCSRVAVLQQVLGPQAAPHGFFALQQQHHHHAGAAASPPGMVEGRDDGVMPPPLLFRALASLNLLLLLGYLLLLLLAKLFARLHSRATAKDPRTTTTSWYHGCADDGHRAEATDDAAAADIVVQGQPAAETLFWFDEAVFAEDSCTLLLGDEGKHLHHPYAATAGAARCLPVESAFPVPTEEESSARISLPPRNQNNHRTDAAAEPVQVQVQEQAATSGIAVDHVVVLPTVPEQRDAPVVVVASPPEENTKESDREEDARRDGDGGRAEVEGQGEDQAQAAKSFAEGRGRHDVKLFVNNRALADTRKLLLEGVSAAGGGGAVKLPLQDDRDRNGDSSRFGASSTLASESTSKSSVEWQSSTVTKDSETEYPFSSSSRRSSARWESYTLFRKYDEDMVYFHRIGAQKLTETESFRSIKYQPRSMSERIVHKLTPSKPSAPIGLRDPYPDLERAYVAQVCLTWEALNWNHTSFRRHNGGDGNMAARCCPARVAQEFQQFQVLLHRFVENEPYEVGRRPEVYARMKNSSPKLLLVPEFRDEDDEKDDLISAVQFLIILEEAIRTFMAFLRADKRSHYEMFREMVKRRSSAVDQTLVFTLKKANKRKKSRVKDLTRPRRCLRRTKLREEEELSILLGLIDLKVVARVLRMPEITDQQLHWCEEKMNRVRVDPLEGKVHRDPSPLFYPAH